MNNRLLEEIQSINYLFGYKKGVVISEQSLENTPVGKVGGEELGKAPSDVVELMKSHLENSDSDVVDWCDKMKQKHGEDVAKSRVKAGATLARKDPKDPRLLQFLSETESAKVPRGAEPWTNEK